MKIILHSPSLLYLSTKNETMKKLLIASAIMVFSVNNGAMAQGHPAKKQLPSKLMQQRAEKMAKALPQTSAPKTALSESAQDAAKRAAFNSKAAQLVDPRARSQK